MVRMIEEEEQVSCTQRASKEVKQAKILELFSEKKDK